MSSDTTATHCPYCALQCGIHISAGPDGPAVTPNARFPVNKGGLCIKGWSSTSLLGHDERLRTPLLRAANGAFVPVSWDHALAEIAARFRRLQSAHGPDSVGVFGGGSLTNETAYMLGKFARIAVGTANIDYNGRFCMSSAAAAQNRAFGIDRGLPFPLEDIPRASVILLVGGNPAETMPPIMQYFEAQQLNGGTLVVVDPRRTPTAAWAGRHLRLRPGTDAALANGLLHILIRDNLVNTGYVETRTDGFEAARQTAASYWPERVEQITGVPETMLRDVAHALAAAPSAMILSARGPEQQTQGVTNTLAYINVALALGLPGRSASGFGSLTGQGNGQGGREHGQKSDQLPGYRSIADPAARRHVAQVWGVDESELPGAGKSAYELIDALGSEVRGLFIMGSNLAVSAPDAMHVERRLAMLDTLVVCDFFLSETARFAHVVLPAAQWAEQDGTMTNLEGRVLRRRRAVTVPGEVRTDLDILTGLATALGRPRGFAGMSPREVFDELREATRGGLADYSGITYDRLDETDGVFWPCPAPGHAGTMRLFGDRFATPAGRARFHATPHSERADRRDDRFPLLLTTGRVLAQYQSGTQTRRVASLREVVDEPVAELHPATAAIAGVPDGGRVRLTTRRGSAEFTVKLTRTIREDTIFVPFHWGGDQAINRLTSAALDPVSRMPEFKVCAVRAERAIEAVA
ncbi:MAG TPA: molybdopterin oxidoreductase family protein [Vicinamibacterales bacterium]|nr:molybdopterin oxidoreductase family protein [Vicinamibacterales bacterium]